MLKQRILTAVLLLAALLAAIFYLPPLYWALLMALMAAVAAWEWGGLSGLGRGGRIMSCGVTLAACLGLTLDSGSLLLATFRVWGMPSSRLFIPGMIFTSLVAVFWCLLAPFWLARRWRPNRTRAGKCFLLFLGMSLILATWFACVFLRELHPLVLLGPLLLVWISDSAAYFAGRKFGGKKLAPEISPGKTWAGVYGALAGVLLYGVLLHAAALFLADSLPVGVMGHIARFARDHWWITPLFLLFTVPGILGDLFESLLKRQVGVKDSGKLLPGHGGALDRIDSLMAVLPCAVALITALMFLRIA
ncbi:MAG: phosphatidate cytidylyltransferase [Zoogloeaceae bacterium]|nr:phosphatidate cytidylyltransferase [Zoogloeaceae bacterium]